MSFDYYANFMQSDEVRDLFRRLVDGHSNFRYEEPDSTPDPFFRFWAYSFYSVIMEIVDHRLTICIRHIPDNLDDVTDPEKVKHRIVQNAQESKLWEILQNQGMKQIEIFWIDLKKRRAKIYSTETK